VRLVEAAENHERAIASGFPSRRMEFGFTERLASPAAA
jgi:hypothetical protein